MDTLRVFDLLRERFKSIFSDTLLPVMVKYSIDGKDTLVRRQGSHASYAELVVLTKGGMYSNGFIDHDVYDGIIRNDDGSIRDKVESVNYQYNISTSIYKIITLLQLEVSEVGKRYSF